MGHLTSLYSLILEARLGTDFLPNESGLEDFLVGVMRC